MGCMAARWIRTDNPRMCRVNWGGIGKGDNPKYYGLELIDQFLDRLDQDVLEDQRIPLLDIMLMATPARWWKAHYQVLKDWKDAKQALKERFSKK